jgi:hypothetical protein
MVGVGDRPWRQPEKAKISVFMFEMVFFKIKIGQRDKRSVGGEWEDSPESSRGIPSAWSQA